MEPLLFLAHRLPYPPNKGDKLRSFNFLAHLAARHRVFLGTFIDDPADWQHVRALNDLCAEGCVERIVRWAKRAASLAALVSGEPLSLRYFASARLAQWTRDVVARERISRAFVFSSPMAQYVPETVERVIDFVDMDSAKWADYAERRSWPARSLYKREAERLFAYERAIARRAVASLFVTEEEAQRFRKSAPECAERVMAIRNGVDSEYFSPSREYASPFAPNERAVVFTGAMDYWPNVDAAAWFVREVLPSIRSRESAVRFYIVGMNPAPAVRALSGAGVTVTGRVPDVRPYLAHAAVVVAPLRVARGIQNKVLEAMAMAKPVVVSTAAALALSARPGVELEAAADAGEFASKVLALLDPARAQAMGRLARARVLEDYAWPSSLAALDELFERRSPAPAKALAR